ncbi:hypothetical protein [Nostoc commune]|uniref:hypothetical protein n=1 Tax=Nostoc commune TaxID=1178 RepID=UPI0015E7F9F5|nr:hypothetical protein [Nostoc commune]
MALIKNYQAGRRAVSWSGIRRLIRNLLSGKLLATGRSITSEVAYCVRTETAIALKTST